MTGLLAEIIVFRSQSRTELNEKEEQNSGQMKNGKKEYKKQKQQEDGGSTTKLYVLLQVTLAEALCVPGSGD